MQNRRLLPLLGFGTLLLCLGGTAGCSPQLRRPAPLPALVGQDPVAALQERARLFSSLRALVRFHYRDPNESFSSRQAVVVARPNRLRVEALSLLGSSFLLTTADQQMVAYVPRENTAYVGSATPAGLWKYTGLWIPVEELVDLLLATPGGERSVLETCPSQQQRAVCCLGYRGLLGKAVVWLDERALPARVEQSGENGTLLWVAEYEAFDSDGPLPAVQRLVVAAPAFERQITLQFKEIEVNPQLRGDEFALALPATARVVHVDEEEQ